MTDSVIVQFVLQGGSLATLTILIVLLMRLARSSLPLVRDLIKTLLALQAEVGGLREEFGELKVVVGRLDGRGVCPLLRDRGGPPGSDGGREPATRDSEVPMTDPQVPA